MNLRDIVFKLGKDFFILEMISIFVRRKRNTFKFNTYGAEFAKRILGKFNNVIH